jgi:hypothetical protein
MRERLIDALGLLGIGLGLALVLWFAVEAFK